MNEEIKTRYSDRYFSIHEITNNKRRIKMSKPKYPEPKIAKEAIFEIQSAMSALNMLPNPIETKNDLAFISESDANVKHAMIHIETVHKYLCNLYNSTQKIITESEKKND